MNILGLSAFYHDSAAALVVDGQVVAAAQEERFTRRKHDPGFPGLAIGYCLKEAGISFEELDHVVFYDKPLIKFERLLETYLSYAPKGYLSFVAAMPIWIKEKLFLKQMLRKELAAIGQVEKQHVPAIMFTQHHQSHAASAFYPSPFERAAVLCLDGVGEWATTTVWQGDGKQLKPLWEVDFPHSLGLLYSAFTYYTGFKVNSGEYKLMGLAPYGEPRYADLIREHLVDIKDDGSFRLNMEYFNYATGLTMTNSRFDELFGGPPREAESKIGQKQMDIARSIQEVTEEIVVKLGRTVRKETGEANLCLAGGVALNCVANGVLLRENVFDEIWIQPAAGDAGGALGAALSIWHEYLGNERVVRAGHDSMAGAYLGPIYSGEEIETTLTPLGAVWKRFESDDAMMPEVARLIADDKVIGWFSGRMEFGPRALGGRSIIGDARSREMQSVMNLKIKYRESFRPFAPVVLAEHVSEWFDLDRPSPYMLLVADVHPDKRLPEADSDESVGFDKLKVARTEVPAVTHVDGSARVQTVHPETNPRFYQLLTAFYEETGCPVMINTSFNVRGEPIVCTPEDAYRCFMRTEMDYLVVENYLFAKADQPAWDQTDNWQEEFELD